MKCKTILNISLLYLALFSIICPLNLRGHIIHAQAPESPEIAQILAKNLILEWKLYLYNRLIEEGFSYKDFRKLRTIAYCESRWRQYNRNGEVLSGLKHPPDKGIFQINTAVHKWDVSTPELNIEAAIKIYKESGIKAWVCKP